MSKRLSNILSKYYNTIGIKSNFQITTMIRKSSTSASEKMNCANKKVCTEQDSLRKIQTNSPIVQLCRTQCQSADGTVPNCKENINDDTFMASIVERLQGKCIEVEGNIGSGKSTLTNSLFKLAKNIAEEQLLEKDYAVVHGELVNPTFLKMFYQEPARYAFAFQMYMLTTRIFQMDEAYRQSAKENKIAFLDRGAVGDVLFALHNYSNGSITEDEMKIYESVTMDRFPQSLSEKVNAVLYLDVDPEQCWYRMTTVRQREAENGVPPAYLNGIDSVYFHLMIDWLGKRKGGFYDMNIGVAPPVLVARWDNFGCTRQIMSDLADLVENKRASPEVHFTTDDLSINAEGYSYVISNQEDLHELLVELKEKDVLMRDGALLDSIAIDWSLDHDNAFKRVSMAVLSYCGSVTYFGEATQHLTPKYNKTVN